MANPPFLATPTVWEFMQDDAFVRVILGPIGSSKSVSCFHEIMKRAIQQAPNADGLRKTRFAIVRNTVDQLKSTSLKTFSDWFGHWANWRASEKTYHLRHHLPDGTQVQCEILALSMDEPDSVRKALSLELTGVFINEAREVAPEVIDGLLMRLRRYPSKKDGGPTWSGAILDSNPPDDGSWFHDKLENPPENWRVFTQPPAILNAQEWLAKFGEDPPEDEGVKDAQDETWWVNPDADNLANLDPEYYRALIPGKTADFRDVYLRNRYGRSLSGTPVYDRVFNVGVHVAATRFTPLKSADHPVIIGLDFGRTPAATIIQRNARGQLVVLDELNSTNMGIETFLASKLTPLLTRADYLGTHIVVAPDPAGFAKQQVNEISPAEVVRRAGYKVVRPHTNNPELRIQAVERVMTRFIDGKPSFQVNPECVVLIRGLKGGYRYAFDRKGNQSDRPDKNEFSHGQDALQYACLIAEGGHAGNPLLANKRRDVQVVSASGWT